MPLRIAERRHLTHSHWTLDARSLPARIPLHSRATTALAIAQPELPAAHSVSMVRSSGPGWMRPVSASGGSRSPFAFCSGLSEKMLKNRPSFVSTSVRTCRHAGTHVAAGGRQATVDSRRAGAGGPRTEDGREVLHAVAVVGRAPHRRHALVPQHLRARVRGWVAPVGARRAAAPHLISLVAELVRAHDERHVVHAPELVRHVAPERVPGASAAAQARQRRPRSMATRSAGRAVWR